MFSVAPVSSTPPALTLPSSVAAASASDQVSTRLTPVALPAPLPDTKIAGDPQRNNTPITGLYGNVAEANAESVTSSGSSSAFLAQLFGQEESAQDDQIGLATTFAKFAPAPTYNTLIGYSVVKFRPSNAGLPSPYVSASRLKTQTASVSSQAYGATQSRNAANPAGTTRQRITVAG